MMRLLISTTCRHKPAAQASGHLFVFDFENQRIVQRSEIIEPPFRAQDTNPRGGIRGYKGIAIREDCVAVGNSSCIYLYDLQWKLITKISHPSCAGIHDIAFDGDSIWLSSSRNDLLLNFDFSGQLRRDINLREYAYLTDDIHWGPKNRFAKGAIVKGERDFRHPGSHILEVWDQAHVNSVVVLPDGKILLLMGLLLNRKFIHLLLIKKLLIRLGIWRKIIGLNRWLRSMLSLKVDMHSDLVVRPATGHSVLLAFAPDGTAKRLFAIQGAIVPSHSVRVLQNGSGVFMHTTEGRLVHFDLSDGHTLSSTRIGEKFLRGAAEMPDGSLVLGDNQGIIHFDLENQQVLNRFKISEDQDEAVFDIKILGPQFDLPPLSFMDHHREG